MELPYALSNIVKHVCHSNHWAKGGDGAEDLATAVVQACKAPTEAGFKFLYDVDRPIKDKILTICRNIYAAEGVDYSELALNQIEAYEKSGYGNLPICMAKTQVRVCEGVLTGNVAAAYSRAIFNASFARRSTPSPPIQPRRAHRQTIACS